MQCNTILSKLSAYLDQELAGFEMIALRDHLSGCSQCRQEAETLQSLKRAFSQMSAPEVPFGLEQRLIERTLGTSASVPLVSRPRLRTFGVLGYATAVAAALVIGVALGMSRTKGGPADAPGVSQSIAYDIRHDQMFMSSTDPLSGLALPQHLAEHP